MAEPASQQMRTGTAPGIDHKGRRKTMVAYSLGVPESETPTLGEGVTRALGLSCAMPSKSCIKVMGLFQFFGSNLKVI